MPGKTNIEWATDTWNPVTGCTRVSAGCDHCYAEAFAERFRGVPGHPYEQGFDLRLWPERLEIPLRWTKPRRIFVNSMSDLFHADVPDEYVARIFAVMGLASRHTFQVLTKRPQRMHRLIADRAFAYLVLHHAGIYEQTVGSHLGRGWLLTDWPAPNVWLGVSVESQDVAWRIDRLVKTPAAVRFLSCEPLLGPIDLSPWLWHRTPLVDWVIAGGESAGPPERSLVEPCFCRFGWVSRDDEGRCIYCRGLRLKPNPVALGWARGLRDQCVAAGVPFFWKQWGGPTPKAGGRELDGRAWDEMPGVAR
jgi:protein gp37